MEPQGVAPILCMPVLNCCTACPIQPDTLLPCRDDIRPGISEASWRTALNLMLYDIVAVSSPGARVAVLTFSFLALIVTSTYTANLAAFVTIRNLATQINSVDVSCCWVLMSSGAC
jgi:hypothetical protein